MSNSNEFDIGDVVIRLNDQQRPRGIVQEIRDGHPRVRYPFQGGSYDIWSNPDFLEKVELEDE